MQLQAVEAPIIDDAVGDRISRLQLVAPLNPMEELPLAELDGGARALGAARDLFCPLCGRSETGNNDDGEAPMSGLSE